MTTITTLFDQHDQRGINKWRHYLEIYERHFNKFVGKKISILEIGVEGGGSLQLWKKYFGKECNIIGIDIDPKCKYEEEQITVEIGDQTDIKFLQYIVDTYGPFDIIIDDGSHMQKHIHKSFQFLYQHVKENGLYLIEDTHCCYLKHFQGGFKHPLNMVDFFTGFIHDLNFRYIKDFFYSKKLDNLKSLCFYDSLIFIEKEKEEERFIEIKGKNVYKRVTVEEVIGGALESHKN